MAAANQTWQAWAQRLADGDEVVVGEFWGQYGDRLQGLAAKFLTPKMRPREGPEDVVQSVCRTFLRRAKAGQFELADSNGLWRLLCAITVAKVREKVRYHGRQKRSFEQEQRLDGSRVGGVPVQAIEPTPEEAVEFADELRQLLDGLDDEERQILMLRMEDYTYPEIAERTKRSTRTVRRIVKRLKTRLQHMLGSQYDG